MAAVGQTYTQLLYRFVFATQDRRPWLEVAWRPRLCEYLGGMVRQAGGASYGINGVGDHLHLLLRLRPEVPLATLMRDWKAYSSRWVHRNVPGAAAFAWQRGSCPFPVLSRLVGRLMSFQGAPNLKESGIM